MANTATVTAGLLGNTDYTNFNNAYTATNAATNLNTASTLVLRDSSGNFNSGAISLAGTGATALTLSGIPAASATSSLESLGSTIAGGNANGTYLSVNSGSGYTGDYVNFELNGTSKFKIDSAGDVTFAGTLNGSGANLTGIATNWAVPGTIGSTTPNTGAFTNLTASGGTTLTAGTASSSSTTGTLIVTGGEGVSGALNVGGAEAIGGNLTVTGTTTHTGATTINSATASSSTTTGALVVTGGEGLGGALNVGGTGSFASTVSLIGTPTSSATSSLLGLGTTLASGSANGTYFSANSASGYTGDFLNFEVNGTSKFKVDYLGDLTFAGTLTGNGSGLTNLPASSVPWATPGTIGSTTPNTGAFTTLSSSGGYTATYAGTGPAASITDSAAAKGDILDLTTTSTAAVTGDKALNISVSGANGTASVTRYGSYSNVTSTGTTSTNVGGYFSASGASTNYGLLVPSGLVGIGNSAPAFPLDVTGFLKSSSGYIMGADLGLFPIASGQSVLQTYHGLQLVGGTLVTPASYVPATVGGGTADTYGVIVPIQGAGIIGFDVLGASGQTANLLQWQNNANTILGSVNAKGYLGVGTGAPGAGLDIQDSLTSTSGTDYGAKISPTVNAGGTEGYTALLVNTTETAVGSGAKLLEDLQVGGTSKFKVDDTGAVTFTGVMTGNGSGLTNLPSGSVAWATPGTIGSTTPNTGAFTMLTANGATTLTAGTSSSSSTTGTLIVTGGEGVSGALNVGGAVGIGGNLTVTGTTTHTGATTINAATASTTTSTGALVVTGGEGLGGALNVGGVTTLSSGTASSSTTTGTLVVTGGEGVSGALNVGGITTLSNTTASTTTSTGALVVSGGEGISGSVNIGGTLGVGTPATSSAVYTAGQIVSAATVIASGATVNFNTGNVQILQSVGGTAITLNNMVDGAAYSVIVSDPTSQTYTFTNCTNAHFVPTNGPTVASTRTVYSILKTTESSATHCYISWITGFN